jgi:hypothetical protein
MAQWSKQPRCVATSTWLPNSSKQLGNLKNPHCLEDPLTGKWHRQIDRELHDFERWENTPNRKDPLTKKMVQALAEMAKGTHEYLKENAFVDWCSLMLLQRVWLAGFSTHVMLDV